MTMAASGGADVRWAGAQRAVLAGDLRATIGLPEIDPGFGNKEVRLAVTEDGVPLDDEGPRLVVPGRYPRGSVRDRGHLNPSRAGELTPRPSASAGVRARRVP